MRTRRRQALGVLAAGALAAALFGGVATAQADARLQVTGVQGRAVELVLALDPAMEVEPGTGTRGTLEIAGEVIPATTSLDVGPDTRPGTAILVLDASGSMAAKRMTAARTAAQRFVDALPSDVKIGLLTFADSVRVAQPPTTDRAAVTAAIAGVRAEGDTSLYDAVSRALDLAGPSARIIVLSDGKDTASSRTLAGLRERAAEVGTPIDVVAISPSAEQRTVLQSIAGAAGGEVRTAATAAELNSAFIAASGAFGGRVILQASIPASLDASGQPVTATVAIGDAVVTATTRMPVEPSLAAGAAAIGSAPAQEISAAPSDGVLPLLLGMLVTVCLLAGVVIVVRSRQHRHTIERVEQVLRYRTGPGQTSRAIAREVADRPASLGWLDAIVARLPGAARTRDRLTAAEFPLTPGGWLLARIGGAAVLALLLALLIRNVPVALVLGIALAWLGAWVFLQSRATARQQAFANALPDFLMVLASGLRAGLSFTNALQSAAEEDKGEVGRQIRRVLREVQVGAVLDDALMSCARRMDNEDLRWTVTALAIQREVGGNLSTILDTAAATIKGRDELRREVRTLSAEGRLSAYILVALPIGVFAFLFIFRRPYVSLLWTDPLGIVLLIALAAAMIVGWLWMRSVVRIKV